MNFYLEGYKFRFLSFPSVIIVHLLRKEVADVISLRWKV